eukprot:c9241_g1_i1.p1 GENE.c9241_g1_i1~~c9241_g1_i1.p1  ORF type:complete len:474 (+),score=106.57 c9241_g1_i1:81-1424(+)
MVKELTVEGLSLHPPSAEKTGADHTCTKCGELVQGKSILSQGKRWHEKCFTCSGCEKELGTGTFSLSGGVVWCEECYDKYRAPKCMSCHGAVTGGYVMVLSMPIHVECFKCEVCKEPLKAFMPAETEEGKTLIVCPSCYETTNVKEEDNQEKCFVCSKDFTEDDIPFCWEGNQWHAECFRCTKCHSLLGPDNIPVKVEDQPCCQTCGKEPDEVEARCNRCRKVIKDMVVSALGFQFHRHCVVCTYCESPLLKPGFEGTVRIDETGSPCCDTCYVKQRKQPAVSKGGVLAALGGAGSSDLGHSAADKDDEGLIASTTKKGNGFLQIRIRKALDLFKNTHDREAYIVFQIGLQVLYTGKRTVSKAQHDTPFDEVFQFRKINVSETIFSLKLMSGPKTKGTVKMFMKDLVAGISSQEFVTDNGTLMVEFTWRPDSGAKRTEAFEPNWPSK